MFYRQHTDGVREKVPLEGLFAGPAGGVCWVIGGGPSLAELPVGEIAASCAPTFAINLAGSGLLRPTFWTSYDPSSRFHRSIYLDASVIKFVHACRALDLVPETTFKVCECPALFVFDRDKERGFHDFLKPAAAGVADWQDSLIQAIDIAASLGFRELYLAGCEMRIAPSDSLRAAAAARGAAHQPGELLGEFLKRARSAGLEEAAIEASLGSQYHFEERKPLAAAAQTDFHYFRVAQYLRLCRRALGLAGVRLVRVTPGSRLNDYFPYRSAADVLAELRDRLGDPRREETRGRYSRTPDRRPLGLWPMKDFRPHNWPPRNSPDRNDFPPWSPPRAAPPLQRIVEDLREIPVKLEEEG